uniref:Ycf34 n=1 Tax=Trichogloeopsis pedicellata TaxID=1495610 RepID=A0A1G4P0F2_9FLOR|nr:Hypothetical protein ycf34 [Trichogloeopsis pedicellata]SCW24380.1 Hypothetical protein ycf34 [Trichogloeopsis pedicellata]
MCICINCSYVHSCSTYHFIKVQHNENTSKVDINFYPSNPIIQVNLKTIDENIQIDWDVIECLSFLEDPGQWREY